MCSWLHEVSQTATYTLLSFTPSHHFSRWLRPRTLSKWTLPFVVLSSELKLNQINNSIIVCWIVILLKSPLFWFEKYTINDKYICYVKVHYWKYNNIKDWSAHKWYTPQWAGLPTHGFCIKIPEYIVIAIS